MYSGIKLLPAIPAKSFALIFDLFPHDNFNLKKWVRGPSISRLHHRYNKGLHDKKITGAGLEKNRSACQTLSVPCLKCMSCKRVCIHPVVNSKA